MFNQDRNVRRHKSPIKIRLNCQITHDLLVHIDEPCIQFQSQLPWFAITLPIYIAMNNH